MPLTPENIIILENQVESLRSLAHPLRIMMVKHLSVHGETNVTDLFTELEIEQATASHNLKILKNGRIVKTRKDGKNIFYSLTDVRYGTLIHILESI